MRFSVLILVLLAIACVSASRYDFSKTAHSGYTKLSEGGIFKHGDDILNTHTPHLLFNGTIHRSEDNIKASTFYMIFYGNDNKSKVGYREPSTTGTAKLYMCCSTALNVAGICNDIGKPITDFEEADIPHIFIEMDDTTSNYDVEIPKHVVTSSDYYRVVFGICGETNGLEVELDGVMEYYHPHGWLPQHLFSELPSLFIFVGAILAVSAYYSYYFIKFFRAVMSLHKFVAALFIVTALDFIIEIIMFLSLNGSGHPLCCPYNTLSLVSVLFSVFRGTFGRAVLLLVCVGHGIVSLRITPAIKGAIVLLTSAFFLFSAIEEIFNLDEENPSNNISFIVTMLNMTIALWSWFSLNELCQRLEQMQETIKLAMYKKLYNVITGFFVLFALMTFFFIATLVDGELINWKYQWMMPAFFNALHVCLLIAIALIWKPSEDALRMATSSQLPIHDHDGIELSNIMNASQIGRPSRQLESRRDKTPRPNKGTDSLLSPDSPVLSPSNFDAKPTSDDIGEKPTITTTAELADHSDSEFQSHALESSAAGMFGAVSISSTKTKDHVFGSMSPIRPPSDDEEIEINFDHEPKAEDDGALPSESDLVSEIDAILNETDDVASKTNLD